MEPIVTTRTTNTKSVGANKKKRGENIGVFQWLINTVHIDDEDHLFNKKTKVYVHKGNIVCDCMRVNTIVTWIRMGMMNHITSNK